MHPYYGSDRLVRASPTLIENVETQETDMISNNGLNGTAPTLVPPSPPAASVTMAENQNTFLNSAQVSGSGILGNQFPLSGHINPYPSQHLPSSVITHSMQASVTNFNGYVPTTLPYLPNATSTPYMPVATSTPFVQFLTPTTSESLYTGANKVYSPQVSFHFQSPTFSTPPIQMVAPQSDSSTASLSWKHTVPTSMPWASPGNNPISVNFTATGISPQSSTTVSNSTPKKMVKRKSTHDDNGVPEKVHINEERMAARLQTLHLDNNNLQWHPDFEDQWYSQKQATDANMSSGEEQEEKQGDDGHSSQVDHKSVPKNSVGARLNFSDLLKMGMKSQEILPKLILDEINKPCMQVVLWKPPGNFVKEAVRELVRSNAGTPSPDVSTEMNAVKTATSEQNEGMETVPLPLSDTSWRTSEKTNDTMDLDDMEL